MNFNFEFDHSNLSSIVLHQNGIRSLREIEEVINGESFAEEISKRYTKPTFIVTGFTSKSKPLKIAFSIDKSGRVITLQARIASINEIKNEFCRHCKY
jgi:hypothetical protein